MTNAISCQFQDYLSDKAKLTVEEKGELLWRRVAFLAYAFVIFFLGVPLWWLTTTPNRAPLPQFSSEYSEQLEQLYYLHSPFLSNGVNSVTTVWDSLHPQSDYNVHFIFVHNNVDEAELANCYRIQRRLENFVHKYLYPIGVKVAFTVEQLWDFSLIDFLQSQKPLKSNNLQLSIDSSDQQIPASLASELDRLISSAPITKEPLLKMAVFFDDNNGVQLIHNEKPTSGLAIASWGGLFIHPSEFTASDDENTFMNALVAVLFHHFGIKPISSSANGIDPWQLLITTLREHRRRLVVENLLRTLHALNSLYDLADNIADLVISEEVAQIAARSQTLFLKAYNELIENNQTDSESASEARRLAERANTDPSLLELLNFPSDQKYGIYVPLFFPLLAPMLQPISLFAFFLLLKLRKRKKEGEGDDEKKLMDEEDGDEIEKMEEKTEEDDKGNEKEGDVEEKDRKKKDGNGEKKREESEVEVNVKMKKDDDE